MPIFGDKIQLHKSHGLPGWPNDRHDLAVFISTEINKAIAIEDAPVSIASGIKAYQSSGVARATDDEVVKFVNGITIYAIALGLLNDNKAKLKRNPNIVGIYLNQAMEIFGRLTVHCGNIYHITDGAGSIITGICAEYSNLKEFIAEWRSVNTNIDILDAYERRRRGNPIPRVLNSGEQPSSNNAGHATRSEEEPSAAFRTTVSTNYATNLPRIQPSDIREDTPNNQRPQTSSGCFSFITMLIVGAGVLFGVSAIANRHFEQKKRTSSSPVQSTPAPTKTTPKPTAQTPTTVASTSPPTIAEPTTPTEQQKNIRTRIGETVLTVPYPKNAVLRKKPYDAPYTEYIPVAVFDVVGKSRTLSYQCYYISPSFMPAPVSPDNFERLKESIRFRCDNPRLDVAGIKKMVQGYVSHQGPAILADREDLISISFEAIAKVNGVTARIHMTFTHQLINDGVVLLSIIYTDDNSISSGTVAKTAMDMMQRWRADVIRANPKVRQPIRKPVPAKRENAIPTVPPQQLMSDEILADLVSTK